jgi:hypothetical protein
MKVKVKQRAKRYETMSCRCCTRVMLKEHTLDKQSLKEAEQESLSNMLDCDDVLTG